MFAFLLLACAGSPDPDGLEGPEASSSAATGAPTAGTADTQAGPGCLPAGDYDRSVDVAGTTFRYRLHLPPGEAAAWPAVILFHGGGSTADAMDAVAGLTSLGDAEGFATLLPEGYAVQPGTQVWNAGACCGPTSLQPDHVAATVAMLDDAQVAGACLDEGRIHATGHSNGGMMTYRLACEASDRIASIAVSAGTLADEERSTKPPEAAFTCAPARPVPLLHVHGLEDRCVPFGGGPAVTGNDLRPVEEAVGRFREIAGCEAKPTDTTKGPVRTQVWSCPDGVDVELITVEKLGHAWAGSPIYGNPELCGGSTTDAVSTTAEAWRFFAAHGR